MNVDSYRCRAAADRVAIFTGSQTTTNSDSLADNHDHADSDNLAGKTKEDVTV